MANELNFNIHILNDQIINYYTYCKLEQNCLDIISKKFSIKSLINDIILALKTACEKKNTILKYINEGCPDFIVNDDKKIK